MNKDNSRLVVGLIMDQRGDPPYVSVNKLWNETIEIISEKFDIEILNVDSYNVNNDAKYLEFVNKIDIMMLLSPYYTIDRTVKDFPVVFYGLGSMQKGGHWLADNIDSFRSCDITILNCSSCIKIYKDFVEEKSIECEYIPLGVDTSVFYPRDNKSELRHKYKIPEDAFVMVYCGRINIQKNPTLLLSLLRDLKDKYENLILMFIGSYDNFYISEFNDGKASDIAEEFNKLIEKFDISSRIIFFENQNDVNIYSEMISMADIGINLTTLISENFGYTPVEMQACGLPVIGTDWGGLKDTIDDGISGFKIDTVNSEFGTRINVESAKEAIEYFINNPDKVKEMGKNARKNTENKFSGRLFSEKVQYLIQKTFENFVQNGKKADKVKINPVLKNISEKIHELYGGERHVSWEHLHPEIDVKHYNRIVSKCATYRADEAVWMQESVISKGFDWNIYGHRFISFDPRWNEDFELKECILDENEICFLGQIAEHDTVKSLMDRHNLNKKDTLYYLKRLTAKGFILPCRNIKKAKDSFCDSAAFIIPFYSTGNNDDYVWLEEALKSIEKQTDKNWIIFIVDDASPDKMSAERIYSIKEKYGEKVEVIFLNENKGPGNARNVGIKAAYKKGCPFVLFLDSDDMAHPKRVEVTRKLFDENPDTGVVYSSFEVIDEYGNYTDDKDILPSILEIIHHNKKILPREEEYG